MQKHLIKIAYQTLCRDIHSLLIVSTRGERTVADVRPLGFKQNSKHFVCSVKTTYEKVVNELNREIDVQRSQLQDQQTKSGQTMNDIENVQKTSPNKLTKNLTTNGPNLRDQLAIKEEQRQELIRALADIRGDMVKIAEGNLKAMSEEDKQSLSVQALITNRTAQLQEKIDEYETQIQNLKRELKAQKNLIQQHMDEATDAREKSSKVKNSV
jgi:chromosome segregation ATPase